MSKAEERALARDFLLARLAACRGALAAAEHELDACLAMFNAPESDKTGKKRSESLEAIDDAVGAAATAVQAAQEVIGDIDPKEGEPDLDGEEDDEDEEDEEEEDDEDEED